MISAFIITFFFVFKIFITFFLQFSNKKRLFVKKKRKEIVNLFCYYPFFIVFEKTRGFVSLPHCFFKDKRVCVPSSLFFEGLYLFLIVFRKFVYLPHCFFKDKRVCVPSSYLLKRQEGLYPFL